MATDTEVVHGTAPIQAGKGIHRAAITVKRPLADVESAIHQFGLPGRAELDVAPADKGVEIRVEVDEREDLSNHLLDAYKGHTLTHKLKQALRTIKSQIETGEVPTVDGQPSGRD